MMKTRNFMEMLRCQWSKNKFVCVGLDTDSLKIPKVVKWRSKSLVSMIFNFNKDIIDATCDIVCAYKPNMGFYEAHGGWGLFALNKTAEYIRKVAPNVPVIADGKRGDIGKTVDQYRQYSFSNLMADAITVNPYLGAEALQPFLEYEDKGIIVLCRTSNPGAGEIQDLVLADGRKVYQVVAGNVATIWNKITPNGTAAPSKERSSWGWPAMPPISPAVCTFQKIPTPAMGGWISF